MRRTKAGQDVIYARFRVAGRQQRHRIGLLRKPGSAVGITRREAEAELRTLLATAATKPEREREHLQGGAFAERAFGPVVELMARKGHNTSESQRSERT
ncbi:MAG: hypothetical protein QOI71_284 [Gaiellales bacterium]|nr:hypothetical protein [Gaiellales bacterium]